MGANLEHLGTRPQGPKRRGDGAVQWQIWAPRAQRVQLLVWTDEGVQREIPLSAEGNGYYSVVLPDVKEGTRYAYRLDGGAQLLPDPASRWQPQGVHQPSAVFFADRYEWSDTQWRGVSFDELVIYETHVGTFTAAGTLDAAIARLAQLVELGVTAVELMPLAQFPGTRNWGYDGVHWYAVQNSYGGPQALQRFVDAAHRAGLAVILDVVYNHLGPEGNYLERFGPYFTDRYHTPWGAALNYDGADSDHVRRFAIDSACMWVRDFHIDGLRLDAVQTIHDTGAYHFLAELRDAVQETAAECGRSVHVIAETNQNDVRLIGARERGGYGLNAVWSDDFHHSVHALLTGERDGYYVDFGTPEQLAKAIEDGFVYDGCYSAFRRRRHGSSAAGYPRQAFAVCIQNHDQVGNRALGDRLGTLIGPEAQRLACGLLLTAPFTPILFMGEEYGERRPFPFFCAYLDPDLVERVRKGRRREFAELAFRWHVEVPDPQDTTTFEQAVLGWSWPAGSPHAHLRMLYCDLLHARRCWPALRDRQHTRARIVRTNGPVLVVERGIAPRAVIWANLADSPLEPPEAPDAATPVLSTAERCYGGGRDVSVAVESLYPWELLIWGEADWRKSWRTTR